MKRNQLLIILGACVFGCLLGLLVTRTSQPWLEYPAFARNKNRPRGQGQAADSQHIRQRLAQQGWGEQRSAGSGKDADAAAFDGGIMQDDLKEFPFQSFPDGRPDYQGELVTAYVKLPASGKRVALQPNQSGEYAKVLTAPGEAVEVRLAFAQSQPGDPVAVSAQDGGVLHVGKMAEKLVVGENGEVGLGFLVSDNPGIHRVTFTTGGGEAKTLNFWAGPEHVMNRHIVAQLNGARAGGK